MKPNWTRELPTVSGWYWCQDHIVKVDIEAKYALEAGSQFWYPLEFYTANHAEWSGPLMPPEREQ